MLFAKQGLMNTMLVVTLNIVLLKVFSLGVTGYMLAVGLSDCICTAYLIIKKRLWGNLTVHPNKHMLKKMLRYSIPVSYTHLCCTSDKPREPCRTDLLVQGILFQSGARACRIFLKGCRRGNSLRQWSAMFRCSRGMRARPLNPRWVQCRRRWCVLR